MCLLEIVAMLWFPQLNPSDYDRIRQPAESSRVSQYNHENCPKKPETRPDPCYGEKLSSAMLREAVF